MKRTLVDPNIDRDVQTHVRRELMADEPGPGSLFAGLGLGPLAVLGSMQAAYAVAPVVCERWPVSMIHVIHIAGLLLAISGGLLALRSWRTTGRGWTIDEDGAIERSRFLGILGVMLSALSILVILGQWAATFMFRPCQ